MRKSYFCKQTNGDDLYLPVAKQYQVTFITYESESEAFHSRYLSSMSSGSFNPFSMVPPGKLLQNFKLLCSYLKISFTSIKEKREFDLILLFLQKGGRVVQGFVSGCVAEYEVRVHGSVGWWEAVGG